MDKDQAITFDLEEVTKAVIRKFPLVADAFANVKFIENYDIKSAATDGQNILYNPSFMDTLSLNDQIFTIAHEGLHIAFEHIDRRNHILKSNKGESKKTIKKYKKLWNVATDAVINQALQAEGLTIKNGFVNIPEAFNQKADTIYFKLLDEYKKKQEEKQDNPNSSQNSGDRSQESENSEGQSTSGNGNGSTDVKDQESNSENSQENPSNENNDNTSSEEQSIEDWASKFGDTCDDHDFWDKENHADNSQDNNENNDQSKDGDIIDNEDEKNNNDSSSDDMDESEKDKSSEDENSSTGEELEKDFSKKNKQKKQDLSKQVMKKIEEQKNKAKEFGNSAGNMEGTFGDVGNAKSMYNWKKILNREFNDYIRQWSSRRATYENDYQSRIVSNYMYNKPRTEVILDTSGSIDDELLKGFIRQLKPLFIDSQLFVGCFDTRFYGFTEIKSNKDITNFQVKGRGGTDLDVAVRAFTQDDKINKVIFTDGCGTMPGKDLSKTKRLFWIIFDNNHFEPCCGKVLYADANEIRREYVKLTQDTPEM